jgi:hypothetical protein
MTSTGETVKTSRVFVGKLEGIRQLEKHGRRSGIIRILKQILKYEEYSEIKERFAI